MLQEGNWWNTTMNLEPRLEKPPLPTWLTAISVKYLGDLNSLFILRLPAALIATAMVLFFFGFCRAISTEKYLPFIGGLVMATSLLIIQQGRTNSWDIYTHAFMVGSIWQMVEGIKRKSWLNILFSLCFMALSILSKGPVSLYALWIPFVIAYSIGDKFVLLKNHWGKLIVFLLLSLVIGFGWNIYMHIFQTEVSEFVLQKETNSWADRHTRPFYFYLHFPIYIGIWAVLLISTFFYKYAAPRINNYGNYRFVVFWVLLSIFFLSVIPTKKERYLLPAIIPMCLAVTYIIYAIYQRFKANNLTYWDNVVVSVFSCTLHFPALVLPFVIGYFYRDSIDTTTILSASLISALGILGIVLWKRKKLPLLFGNSIVIVCIFCLGLIPKTAEWFYHYNSFNSLSEIGGNERLTPFQYYTETEDTDPRIVWQIGKPTQPISSISLEDSTKYPLVLISFSPIENIIATELLEQRTVSDFGLYDIFRKESKWKYRVQLIELKP